MTDPLVELRELVRAAERDHAQCERDGCHDPRTAAALGPARAALDSIEGVSREEPQSVDEVLAGLEVGPDPVYWQGYRDGLTAASPSREGAGLDVERLARALRADHIQDAIQRWIPTDQTSNVARMVAAEYARLASEEQRDV